MQCSPKGATQNLYKKELRLHKPLFVMGGLLAGVWIVAIAATYGQTWYSEVLQTVMVITVALYIPLLSVLAGAVSLGEEKNLGVTASQLTLPISAARQWWIKFEVCTLTWFVLALLLPFALLVAAATTTPAITLSLTDVERPDLLILVGVVGFLFVMSFWAASFTSNAVRAALIAVLSIGILGACVALGAWSASLCSGLQTALVLWLMGHGYSLPALQTITQQTSVLSVFLLLFMCAALSQCFGSFRTIETDRSRFVKCSLILVALAFAISFWAFDWQQSAEAASGYVKGGGG